MKLKKVTALCLATLMMASVLGGCGNKEVTPSTSETEKSTEKSETNVSSEVKEEEPDKIDVTMPLAETMTFTMANNYFDDKSKLEGSNAMKALEELTNVHFEHIEYSTSEWNEKINLLIAGGDYPDCIIKNIPDRDELGKQGVYIPLEDLIREYAPNMCALMDKYDCWDEFRSPDGHIYAVGQFDKPKSALATSYLYCNFAWLEKVGMEAPTNMDEFTEVLRAFKENDVNGNGDPNDEIPLHLNMNHTWRSMYGMLVDGLHWWNHTALLDDGDYAGKISYYPRTEEFKENLLEYMVLWYQEGLVDQDMFTTTYEQASSIGTTQNIYGMFWNTLSSQAAPEANFTDYHTLMPFENGYFPLTPAWMTTTFAITSACEHPEVLMAWVDTLYTEEGGLIAYVGAKEGQDYIVNENGTYKELEGCSRIHGYGTAPGMTPELYSRKDRGAGSYLNDEVFFLPETYGKILPSIQNTEDEATIIADITANIQPYMENYVAQVITGEISLDDTWEDYQNELIKMGVEDLEKAYQAGYDRANKN